MAIKMSVIAALFHGCTLAIGNVTVERHDVTDQRLFTIGESR